MTNDFYILGSFVNAVNQRETEEDLTPQIFKKFISRLNEGDELTLHINSLGGDVYSGISIANMIKELNAKGVITTAIIEGCACSIASVVVCACQKVKMYESSFLMVHRCWSTVQGNAIDLRKEAEVMEKIDKSIMSFYKSHFNLQDSEIEILLDNETWIQGTEAKRYNFNCELIAEDKHFSIAAKANKIFKKTPKDLIMEEKEMEKTMEEKETEEQTQVQTPDEEKKEEQTTETPDKADECGDGKEEKKDEETVVEEVTEEVKEEEPTVEQLKEIIEQLKERIKELEGEKEESVESRVAKCQSTFQNKINGFKDELKAKDEELQKFKDSVSSLNTELDNTKKELQKMSAAFEDKSTALAKLNASVLTPKDNSEWKSLKGKEFFDYLKKNPQLTR